MYVLFANYEASSEYLVNFAASTEELYIYGNSIDNIDKGYTQSSVMKVYDSLKETWREVPTTGTPPGTMYMSSTAFSGHIFYLFGGYNYSSFSASLHQLDTRSMTWSQLSPQQNGGPMGKFGSKMIYYNNSLIVVGGYGVPSGELQFGSQFVHNKYFQDGRGWTNEIHMYNISKGKVAGLNSLNCTIKSIQCYN